MNPLNNDDCNDCKDTVFIVYIDNIDKNIWLVEKLSLLLLTIKNLGYSALQSKLVAAAIIESNKKYKLFTGPKTHSLEVIDILTSNLIECSIIKKQTDIFK